MKSVGHCFSLTVDVEDWPQSSWDRCLPIGDYCADNTRRILELLAEFPTARATFFVLGKFAERHPGVVDEIRQAGHELGSHGYGHEELFHLGRDGFAADLSRSTNVIADASGVRPVGFRAPDFSIVGESLWALDVLAEQGYQYDSSIVPTGKKRYGIENWPAHPARVMLPSGGSIVELPVGTLTMMGRQVPLGGGYARLLPGWMLTRAMRLATRTSSFPPVFYCHPYEVDAHEFGRLDIQIPIKVRLHQGIGRSTTIGKLRQLLAHFRSVALCDEIGASPHTPKISYERYALDPESVSRPQIFTAMPPIRPAA
jgi:polysaccharide deacetylase family protein (PEP-CTERM system associated)